MYEMIIVRHSLMLVSSCVRLRSLLNGCVPRVLMMAYAQQSYAGAHVCSRSMR